MLLFSLRNLCLENLGKTLPCISITFSLIILFFLLVLGSDISFSGRKFLKYFEEGFKQENQSLSDKNGLKYAQKWECDLSAYKADSYKISMYFSIESMRLLKQIRMILRNN